MEIRFVDFTSEISSLAAKTTQVADVLSHATLTFRTQKLPKTMYNAKQLKIPGEIFGT